MKNKTDMKHYLSLAHISALIYSSFTPAKQESLAESRPNIVFILADHMGWADRRVLV